MTRGSLTLVHQRTDRTLADRLEVAVTRRARRRGLLGRDGLADGAGMVLVPCLGIHTAFMRFPIDVVFLDGGGRAVKLEDGLAPWRMAIEPSARAVVELPAGTIRAHGLAVGDRLCLRDTGGQQTILTPARLRRRAC